MRRKGAGDGGPQDVETVLDDLYTTPPPAFVPRREELAAAARTAGNADDARRIHAARRPTLAAWAANLLLRAAPEESRRFLELGTALREAYRTLDADGVKELSDRRRSVVAALTRQAVVLADRAGHRLSGTARQDIESTLRAVLADQQAADRWATGRLEGPLTPPADFAAGQAAAVTGPVPAKTASPSAGTRAEDDLAERRRRRRREQAERARREAEAAGRRLHDRRAEQEDAAADLERAQERVSEAERRVEQARERLRRAEAQRQEAADRQRAATDAVTGAERTAHEAARDAERLATADGP
ncbi:hypothetical protein [Streptomyces phaeofaciens]|uniref:hypothetical protein n=1 Tax=Streptomyces phaeofaciens TaxID=68254 RepID=UPI0036C64E0D